MKSGYAHIMLGLVFACSSCHDVVVRDTPQNVFEVFWTTLDEHYVYFEEKGVDWDSMYVAYAPRARQVHTDAELLSLLHEMIVPLQDGHVSIVAGDTVVRSKKVFYESREDKEYYGTSLGAFDVPGPFNAELMHEELRDDDSRRNLLEYCDVVGEHCYRHCRGPFLYFIVSGFSGDIATMKQYYEKTLVDYMLLDWENTYILKKGIIIDLRDNLGGYVANVLSFVSHFYEGNKELYRNFYKTGRGKQDIEQQEIIAVEGKGTIKTDMQIVVLTNRYTYSAGNLCAFIMSDLPNVALIGEKTGGGGGSGKEVTLPNGWVLKYPYLRCFSLDGINMELGIEPDIHVPYDGKDSLDVPLLTALEYLDEKI